MYATSAHAQLMDDWLVRTSATPDALVRGATAVFRNPAMLSPSKKGEGMLMDVRGPGISGITGMAAAGTYRLDARSSVGIGYQHIGVDGVELTVDAPDEGTNIVIGQDLIAVGAAHSVSRLTVGAGAQYLHSSVAFNQPNVLRLGLGAQYALPLASLPITIAVSGQSQDTHTFWAAGGSVEAPLPSSLHEWSLSASYGAAGGDLRPGVTHRVSADAGWRGVVSLQGGIVSDPENDGRVMTAIGSIGVRVNRYELGIVRESLANGFGAVHTFRIGILF